VQVNSPDSGKVLELFAAEGDTVAVGGKLFKVEIGNVPEGVSSSPVSSSLPPQDIPKKEISNGIDSKVNDSKSQINPAPSTVSKPKEPSNAGQSVQPPVHVSAPASKPAEKPITNYSSGTRKETRVILKFYSGQDEPYEITYFRTIKGISKCGRVIDYL
jgi:2-oxoglutarate dehydrogenase E2 component (dihydrolipoamide succinyltransferase)